MLWRVFILWLTAGSGMAFADDWPQWRGPDRNGISRESGWLAGWRAGAAPRVAWRAAAGRGHSAISIHKGRAYTMGWDGANETVTCLNAETGRPLWKQSYPCRGIKQWPGPRATPTVDGDTVYTLGLWGRLSAWNTADGQQRWAVTLAPTCNPDEDYGFAWSPLVSGDLLILSAGRRGLAVRKSDGSFAWGNDGLPGVHSPVPYEWDGRRGVAVVTTDPGRKSVSLIGVDPLSGAEQWRYGPWPEYYGAVCVDPIMDGGSAFITSSEQHKASARVSFAAGRPKLDWTTRRAAGYTGAGVLHKGHVYIISSAGMLKCLDWENGEEKWSQHGFGDHGSLIAADGKLIVQTSRGGEIVVVQATSAGYRELRRTTVFTSDADTFTPPVLANGRIYARSYKGEVACLDLRK